MILKPQLPYYIKFSLVTIGILAFFYMLYIGRIILVPLTIALIIAILLNPVVYFLEKKIYRIVAIVITMLLAFILVAGVVFFIGSQVNSFNRALPEINSKLTTLIYHMVQNAGDYFGASQEQVDEWITGMTQGGINNTVGFIGQTINSLSAVLLIVFLVPVYVYLFLYYKPLLLNFLAKLFPSENYHTVIEVLNTSKTLIQNYLVGIIFEFAILSALYAFSLFMLGIPYALLLGTIGGLLSLLPIIGRHLAAALPMLLAVATKEPVYAFYVLGCYLVAKFIDNNFINPMIVASKVKINALVSIFVVLLGGFIWGAIGMFLALPITAIVKVIFDHIDELKAYGFLLGDNMPNRNEESFLFRELKTEVVDEE